MGSENEPAKLLLPYLQRADELQKHEHLVAYYCRLYAMERGLKIPQNLRTKTTTAILVSLMNQLEKDKKSLKLGPEDNLYVEGFASNVFAKADKQDRAGRADLNTAKTFYAASIFFEILNQFGELQPDLEQKQKYAAWKAADIRKALKEGRKPVPGPPGGDKDDMSNTGYDLEPSQDIPGSHNESVAQDLPPQFHDRGNYQSSTDLPASPPSSATSQNLSRHGSGAEDLPPQFHDRSNYQSSTDLPAPPAYPTSQNFPGSHHGSGAEELPPQFHDKDNYQSSTDLPTPPSYPANDYPPRPSYPTNGSPQNMPLPPPSYPSSDYSADDFNSLPSPPNISPNSAYPQQYHHPMHPQEPRHPPPQNYPSHEAPSPSYTLPNFQSYPGFADHSLPAAPTGHPSFYQGPEVSYPQQSAPPLSRQPSTVKYNSTSRVESNVKPASTTSQTFHYDSNYTPPPDKIVEAHKAARFAVGALAFDDVVVAVDFLRKSLELLTNPSASQ